MHAMWCFSFERYNGILGDTPSNNRSLQLEKTMMKQFIQQIESQKCFPHVLLELESFFPTRMVGSVGDTAVSSEMYIKRLKLSKTGNFDELFFQSDLVVPLGQMSQHAL